ncbi:MAG: ankyrin repeat domain-containing protein, partial [bacterium]
GGNLELCQLLAHQGGVDFVNVVNHSGNSPLSHAVFHGRKEVIQWLLTESKEQDKRALDLAKEFVEWSEGDPKRQEILDMLVE